MNGRYRLAGRGMRRSPHGWIERPSRVVNALRIDYQTDFWCANLQGVKVNFRNTDCEFLYCNPQIGSKLAADTRTLICTTGGDPQNTITERQSCLEK